MTEEKNIRFISFNYLESLLNILTAIKLLRQSRINTDELEKIFWEMVYLNNKKEIEDIRDKTGI